jgi:hypothetical protein
MFLGIHFRRDSGLLDDVARACQERMWSLLDTILAPVSAACEHHAAAWLLAWRHAVILISLSSIDAFGGRSLWFRWYAAQPRGGVLQVLSPMQACNCSPTGGFVGGRSDVVRKVRGLSLQQSTQECLITRKPITRQACCTANSMRSTKSDIALVADSSPPRTADSATEILAAALSELLREAKRHTALLEVLVKRPAVLSPPSPAATPAAEPRKSAAARAAVVVPASPKTNKGALNGSTGGGSPCFSVEELRVRARAHNHLLDIDSPKSRAILALLLDDGTVPDHFPVRREVVSLMLVGQLSCTFEVSCQCHLTGADITATAWAGLQVQQICSSAETRPYQSHAHQWSMLAQADMDGFSALTSQQLHGLLRAYGLHDSNATLSS